MNKIKFILVVTFLFANVYSFSQKIEYYNCDLCKDYFPLELVDNSEMDYWELQKQSYEQKKKLFVLSNQQEYENFTKLSGYVTDFKKYNIIVFFSDINSCIEPVREARLFRDLENNTFSITIIVYLDGCKRGGQTHKPTMFLIPKTIWKDVETICYSIPKTLLFNRYE